ncbi:MAG TPA: hypothetical protein VK498_01775 [Ferruginibacter sp.]|nr:hypothetical protein [Ferruginibacter sp.]
METKYNEATQNRPLGDRIIDAPFVFIDIKKYGYLLIEEEAWRKYDRNSITVYKTEGLTMVLSCLRNGATLMNNLVDGVITLQVLEGTIEFTVDTSTVTLQKQQIITVHAGIMYTVKAVENTLLLMTNKVENKTQNIAA